MSDADIRKARLAEVDVLVKKILPLLREHSTGACLVALLNLHALVLKQLDQDTRDSIIDTMPLALREILRLDAKPPGPPS